MQSPGSLPVTNGLSRPAVYGAAFAPLAAPLRSTMYSRFLRRSLSVSQMDLEFAVFQLLMACRSPARVYKLTQHRKQTKNQYARDDPAFAAVVGVLVSVCAVAYGVAYEYTSPLAYGWLVLQAWLNFVGGGALIATACWAIANKYMRASMPLPHSVEQEVEWLYAWDVHCNSYVPVLLLIFAAQLPLLPLLMRDGFLPALLGNTLYAAAAVHYIYITFSGYLSAYAMMRQQYHNVSCAQQRCITTPFLAILLYHVYAVLPFLQRQNLFLAPIGVIAVLYLLLVILQVNVARIVLGLFVA